MFNMNGRIVITGGSGFIGSHLIPELLDHDYEIIVLTRSISKSLKKLKNFADKIKLIEWDAVSLGDWVKYIDGAKAVVNLAGANIAGWLWTRKRKEVLIKSRLNVTSSIVDAIMNAENKPEVLIQASATGYYGYKDNDDEVTEDDGNGDDFLATLAYKWEETVKPIEEEKITRVVYIRTGNVLSRDGGALPLLALPIKLFVGVIFGNGKQWFPWIHMKDEINIIIRAIENDSMHGPYNLCSPNTVQNKTLVKSIGKVLKRPVFIRIPSFLMRIFMGELSTALLKGHKAVPKKLLQEGYKFEYPELLPALENIYSK